MAENVEPFGLGYQCDMIENGFTDRCDSVRLLRHFLCHSLSQHLVFHYFPVPNEDNHGWTQCNYKCSQDGGGPAECTGE